MNTLANKSVSLQDFLGEEKGQALIKKLQHCTAIEKQILVLNNFFFISKLLLMIAVLLKK